jgi:hypothetical protein
MRFSKPTEPVVAFLRHFWSPLFFQGSWPVVFFAAFARGDEKELFIAPWGPLRGPLPSGAKGGKKQPQS